MPFIPLIVGILIMAGAGWWYKSLLAPPPANPQDTKTQSVQQTPQTQSAAGIASGAILDRGVDTQIRETPGNLDTGLDHPLAIVRDTGPLYQPGTEPADLGVNEESPVYSTVSQGGASVPGGSEVSIREWTPGTAPE